MATLEPTAASNFARSPFRYSLTQVIYLFQAAWGPNGHFLKGAAIGFEGDSKTLA